MGRTLVIDNVSDETAEKIIIMAGKSDIHSLLCWLLSGNEYDADGFSGMLKEQRECEDQIAICHEALREADKWDDWNTDSDGRRREPPVYVSRDEYVRSYECDLCENIEILKNTIDEIEKVRTAFENSPCYRGSDWFTEVARFIMWYNMLYAPDTPLI